MPSWTWTSPYYPANPMSSYAYSVDSGATWGNLGATNSSYHSFGVQIFGTPGGEPTPSVPEPGTMLLMGVGAAGAAWMRRRKMKKSGQAS